MTSSIVFEGGPQHGKVQAVSQLPQAIQAAYMRPMPIWVPPEPPPRPKWWRHPLRWYRWKPPEPVFPPMPVMEMLTYRPTGEVRDGATVYEIDGDWGFKGPEASDASARALVAALRPVDPRIRRDPATRWVMSPHWYGRVLSDPGTTVAYSPPDAMTGEFQLLGIPVDLRDDGGAPHLENRRYPQDYP